MTLDVDSSSGPLQWPALRDDNQLLSGIEVVACDLDGTLLGEHGRIPDGFWEALEELNHVGVTFVPASGRQLATLKHLFSATHGLSFIAENGAMVEHQGKVVSTNGLSPQTAHQTIDLVRQLVAQGRDVMLVVCGRNGALLETNEPRYLAEVEPYYRRFHVVEDLHAVDDEILKLAIFSADDPQHLAETELAGIRRTHQVLRSAPHWIDIMGPTATKGAGLRELMAVEGVGEEHSLAVGDFLNDVGLLQAAGVPCTVANAHSDLVPWSRYQIPANTEHGVVQLMWAIAESQRLQMS